MGHECFWCLASLYEAWCFYVNCKFACVKFEAIDQLFFRICVIGGEKERRIIFFDKIVWFVILFAFILSLFFCLCASFRYFCCWCTILQHYFVLLVKSSSLKRLHMQLNCAVEPTMSRPKFNIIINMMHLKEWN